MSLFVGGREDNSGHRENQYLKGMETASDWGGSVHWSEILGNLGAGTNKSTNGELSSMG